MQLSGRPLLDTRADAGLFVDPFKHLDRLSRAIGDGLNVLVTGWRGSGKTSLLRQFLLHRRASGPAALLVSAGTASSPSDVLTLVLRALATDTAPASRAGEPSVVDLLDALATDTSPAAVLLDNLPPRLAHALFGQLRDELWRLPLVWVVTCADTDEVAFLRPPADAFFDTVVRLPPLDPPAMRDLLRRRASADELDDEALSSVVELSDGNPRSALVLARRLTSGESSPELVRADEARRREAVTKLGRPAQMLLTELEASGAASASDETMLSRLGWTRARAAQVLEQLASAGLVEATDVRNGPGRPRRVYRPSAAQPR